MKKTLIIVAVAIVLLVGAWILIPSSDEASSSAETQQSQVDSIVTTAQSAVAKAEQGQAYIYDVRSPEEYNAEHAQQAVNHDVELLKVNEYPDVPKDSEIYVYCRSGNRSAQATAILESNGYTNVTDLGGLDNMRAAGVL